MVGGFGGSDGKAGWRAGKGRITVGIVCFTKMFGLNPEDGPGAVEGFEIEVEPDQVCIFDTKLLWRQYEK